MDSEQFVAAGVYDPDAPDAAEQLDLLAYLVQEGVTLDQIVEAATTRNLTSAVADIRMRGGDVSAADLAAEAGVPVEDVVDTYRLLGIAVHDADEPMFAEAEHRLIDLLGGARAMMPEGMTEEILRAIGAGLTLVAETAVAAFVGSVEDVLAAGSARTRAEVTTASGDLGLELGTLLAPLLRHHLWAAVLRQRAAMRDAVDRRDSRLSIGFVDLVAFTATTETMRSAELLEFMRSFQSRTFDVVTRAGGRVVKHIGDEIMFASTDADAACDIALALIEEFDDADSPPRGGLAHGMVVARHGDFYGPVVNLAARLTDVAVPGEVLADAAVAAASRLDRFVFEPAGRRQLKGFTAPVAAVSVSRARPTSRDEATPAR
jgi:adenylate cyclase